MTYIKRMVAALVTLAALASAPSAMADRPGYGCLRMTAIFWSNGDVDVYGVPCHKLSQMHDVPWRRLGVVLLGSYG